jgi:preprotein translocase subunit YajC
MLGNSAPLAATSTSSGGFNPTTLIFILVVVVAIYMLFMRPQQRRRQQAQQQQNTLGPGARVRTTAGMYATVVDVDGDDVILEVAPGVEVRYMRRAVMDVISPADTVDEEEAPVDETETDFDEESAETDADDADEEITDTVPADPEPESVHDVEETAYEQATGTKKD